jgi:hypothetical protein
MTLFETLTLVVAVVTAALALIVNMALLDSEKRLWLRRTAWRIVATVMYLFMVLFAIGVVWSFAVTPEPPTRKDILTLLLWLFNGTMGLIFLAHDSGERRRANLSK